MKEERKLKKLASLFCIVLIFILIPLNNVISCNCDAGNARVYLSPAVVSTDSLGVGDTFDIQIRIENVELLWAWGLNLSWNPNVLAMVGSPVEGPFLSDVDSTMFVVAPINNTSGETPGGINCALLNWGIGANGSGLLATVTFQIVSLGYSNIDITYCKLEQNPENEKIPIDFTTTGSTFTSSSTPRNARVYLSPAVVSTDSLGVGDTFDIKIRIENAELLWQWNLDLSWDPDVLTMVGSPVEGSFLAGGGTTSFTTGSVNADVGLLSSVSSTLDSLGGVNGGGLLATVTFEVASLGSSTIDILNLFLYTNPDGNPQEIDSTATGSNFDAGGTPPSTSEGANIDIYTNRGGQSVNVTSDMYGPQELVIITANVTYNGYSAIGRSVVFEITDNADNVVFIRSSVTDNEGLTSVEFRLPWSVLNQDELFGTWTIVGKADVSGTIVSDTCEFLFDYIIEMSETKEFTDLHDHSVNSVDRGQNLKIVINLVNNRHASVNCLFCVSIFDECGIWIASAKTQVMVPSTGYSPKLTVLIPSWAVAGEAKVYLNVLSSLSPSLGGVAYCPEAFETILITE